MSLEIPMRSTPVSPLRLEDVLYDELQRRGKLTNEAAPALRNAQTLFQASALSNDEQTREAMRKPRDEELWKYLPDAGLNALCLSGGGIRSASFALGVLQGLAQRSVIRDGKGEITGADGILTEFDYVSTVSGGGYTGSWLSRWSQEEAATSSEPFKEVVQHIAGKKEPRRSQREIGDTYRTIPGYPDREAKPIRALRDFTNYLAPHLGVFSGDSWTLVATYLRNLVLNWAMLVPMIMAMAALPWVLHFGML